MRNKTGWSIAYLAGLVTFLLALPVTFFITRIHRFFPGQVEQAILVIYAVLVLTLLIPGCIYLLRRRRSADTWILGMILFITLLILLSGIYLFVVKDEVNFQADFLIWSESDFVNDILKFREGYPIYTDQKNNDSFVYPPGTQLVTYFIAWVLGASTKIPVYRAIQLGFTLASAFFGLACVFKILEINTNNVKNTNTLHSWKEKLIWGALGIPLLFLFASNPLTNPFVHQLHNDALAQLVTVIAFWLLLGYVQSRKTKWLIWMAILPAVGFLVKQNLVIWAVFYFVHLAFFDQPRSYKRMFTVGIASFGLLGLVFIAGYALYGENFYYWVIYVLGAHSISPLRSFQHLLIVWLYLILGLIGGVIILRGEKIRRLIGPWLIWLGLMVLQTYTSGVAWMINHIGSACLLAGVWFLAGLMTLWMQKEGQYQKLDSTLQQNGKPRQAQDWLQAGLFTFIGVMLLAGLGFIRTPLSALPKDSERYRRQIEQEFSGIEPENILLDAGTWVYLPTGAVMKDRAPSIGERGYSQTGDFSALIDRLQRREYSRILLRNYHSPDFWYDHYLWEQSSTIRNVLQENYQEVDTIPAVVEEGISNNNYLFSEISILKPKGE